MQDLVDRDDQTFFDEAATERIKDVIIVDNEWQIADSLNPEYATKDVNGECRLQKAKRIDRPADTYGSEPSRRRP